MHVNIIRCDRCKSEGLVDADSYPVYTGQLADRLPQDWILVSSAGPSDEVAPSTKHLCPDCALGHQGFMSGAYPNLGEHDGEADDRRVTLRQAYKVHNALLNRLGWRLPESGLWDSYALADALTKIIYPRRQL